MAATRERGERRRREDRRSRWMRRTSCVIYVESRSTWHYQDHMTPQDAIVDHANGTLSTARMFRTLLEYSDWYTGRSHSMVWIAAGAELAAECATRYRGEATKAHLDDLVAGLGETSMLRIEPGPVSRVLNAEDIAAMMEFARGVRVERAMMERDWARVRGYDRYYLPYFGQLPKPEFVGLSVPDGVVMAVFTNEDTAQAFVDAQDAATRAELRMTLLGGNELFTTVARKGKGLIFNNHGPTRPMMFDSDVCRTIASSSPT